VSSAIERALYGNQGTHGVLEFTPGEGNILLRVAPWVDLSAWVEAVFANAKCTSVDEYPDEVDGLDLPWDIIGFDSYELPEGR
jgi:hypothetical protein